MTDTTRPEIDMAQFVIEELDHFARVFQPTYNPEAYLRTEPFVGYASVVNAQKQSICLLICRHYTPYSTKPSHNNTEYASYLSPLGQIAAKSPGDTHEFSVKHRTGLILASHSYELLAKAGFRPKVDDDGQWDAVECKCDWIGTSLLVRSFRALIRGTTQAPYTRELRYTVQLPAQAILDPIQDEIFRLPVNSFVRISGAPGTGKTTVLIKRLSQKTKSEFLTEDEQAVIKSAGLNESAQWILFSPSDLLKSYLKEALAKELLPASDEHVKVYSTFRREILRDTGFIRVGSHGFFRMPADRSLNLLKSQANRSLLALARKFAAYLNNHWATMARESLLRFNESVRVPMDLLFDEAQGILTAALDIMSKAGTEESSSREAKRRAEEYRAANATVNSLMKQVRDATDQLSVDLVSLTSILARSDDMARLASALGSAPTGLALSPSVPRLVESLQRAAMLAAESINISSLFRAISPAFAEFRAMPEIGMRFYAEGSAKALKDRMISEPELDILLLHALRFVHGLPKMPLPGASGVPSDLQAIAERLRLIVMVDEATDFSPLELACMELVALPRQGGVTISGDLMQRVTERGLRSWDDMNEICHTYDAKNLTTGYRQTARLFNIAKALCDHSTGVDNDFHSAYGQREEDPPALAFKSMGGEQVEDWLTDRICEIFQLSNHHLPTTAVLVPTAGDVEALCAKLLPRIHENGLELDASQSGQALGDTARVRVFPVEHIKGLEFEAVFYIGLDRMEDVHKELLDKYVYVGLSRSRSFLGVTYDRRFPQRLSCIEKHFVHNGTWVPVDEQQNSP